mmetsp:Transcript_42514/g.92430  ORF Transcript_42514/g.92430 Transcript_42514/m.92430 type:complete len:229 (+) Transcript_42514:3-689(+)
MATLAACADTVLRTPNIPDKAVMTRKFVAAWRSGEVSEVGTAEPPDQPEREVQVIEAGKAPRRGVGSVENRVSLLHALAHIEGYAIDLSWDIIARWAGKVELPREFFDDWVKVADDEAKHFELLNSRLKELGSSYGELPGHQMLWEAATMTSHSLRCRLAIVHMVHEARGLDITPSTLKKLQHAGDTQSAAMLTTIYTEEITHVTAGMRWFTFLCDRDQVVGPDVGAW